MRTLQLIRLCGKSLRCKQTFIIAYMQLGCIFPAFIPQVCSDHLGMKFAQLISFNVLSSFCSQMSIIVWYS